jgi:hypothetical protein
MATRAIRHKGAHLLAPLLALCLVTACNGSTTPNSSPIKESGACEVLTSQFSTVDAAYETYRVRQAEYQASSSNGVLEDDYLSSNYQEIRTEISFLISGELPKIAADTGTEELGRIALNQILVSAKDAYFVAGQSISGGNISSRFIGTYQTFKRLVGAFQEEHCG